MMNNQVHNSCAQSGAPNFHFLQTTIEAEGFRSLREGEEVEFVIEPSGDGRLKAVQVTGPGGAPPQVHCAPCSAYDRNTGGGRGVTL